MASCAVEAVAGVRVWMRATRKHLDVEAEDESLAYSPDVLEDLLHRALESVLVYREFQRRAETVTPPS